MNAAKAKRLMQRAESLLPEFTGKKDPKTGELFTPTRAAAKAVEHAQALEMIFEERGWIRDDETVSSPDA